MLELPEPLGDLPIDSKFPLENYRNMMDATKNEIERESFRKSFRQNIKKHINDIFEKYIKTSETVGSGHLIFTRRGHLRRNSRQLPRAR